MTFPRCSCYEALVLPDGTYDVFIVDASVAGATTSMELTILGGEHKGDVVTVEVQGFGHDERDLLGMPGTLTVERGVPTVVVDD